MAERLAEFPGKQRGATGKYNKILNGEVWRLVETEDFNCKPVSLYATMSITAARNGLRVRVRRLPADDHGHAVFAVQAYREKESKDSNG